MIDLSFDNIIRSITCRELSATHCISKGILGGPYKCTFDNNGLTISVEQCEKRQISVVSKNDVAVENLVCTYQNIEKLLMLFDGCFIPLESLTFIDNEELSEKYCERRLQYYQSADFTQYPSNKLLDFDSVITFDVYNKWETLINEADIMHQIFLYLMAKTGLTNDVKLAFLIETAEPMVELVKENTSIFTTLQPGQKGTTLKTCICSLINTYGQDIFSKEIQNNYSDFLQKSVDSRVRIMHIKKNYNKPFFRDTENLLYLVKYSLLYRRIMLELLGISYNKYSDKIIIAVKKWEEWFDKLNKT